LRSGNVLPTEMQDRRTQGNLQPYITPQLTPLTPTIEPQSSSTTTASQEQENGKGREKATQANPASISQNITPPMRPPFPQHLKKKNDEDQFRKFLDVLK